jgi:hypothetical protein
LAVSFFLSLPALFHAEATLGFFPPGPSPLAEPSTPPRVGCPPGVTNLPKSPKSQRHHRPPSGLYSLQGSLLSRPSVSLPRSGCPPGFHLSREFPFSNACSRSHNPFLGFTVTAQCEHCEGTPTLQGFDTTEIGLPLSRLPSLMSFSHLPRPASSITCHPWLMNSPWLQALLPALANQLGISRLPTGALLL